MSRDEGQGISPPGFWLSLLSGIIVAYMSVGFSVSSLLVLRMLEEGTYPFDVTEELRQIMKASLDPASPITILTTDLGLAAGLATMIGAVIARYRSARIGGITVISASILDLAILPTFSVERVLGPVGGILILRGRRGPISLSQGAFWTSLVAGVLIATIYPATYVDFLMYSHLLWRVSFLHKITADFLSLGGAGMADPINAIWAVGFGVVPGLIILSGALMVRYRPQAKGAAMILLGTLLSLPGGGGAYVGVALAVVGSILILKYRVREKR